MGLEISESEFLQQFFREKRQSRANILENTGGSLVETLTESQALELGNAPAFQLELRQLLSADLAGQERTNGETRVKWLGPSSAGTPEHS